ncbi:MAG: hypothetical protein DMF46_08095 [Verrucomicrobia bacterium]|nr:MAG: hypothetical protein DMF46_08095 [Verrucomicrobiota bacterium]
MSVRRASTIETIVNASVRCVAVAIAICSWIAISNHCAFSAVVAQTDAIQSACPFHSQPAKTPPQPGGIQCCKILRAIIPTFTKGWARNDAGVSDVDLYFEKLAIIANSQSATSPLLLDTGPPGARSFAELILQRSILAHAPPVSA